MSEPISKKAKPGVKTGKTVKRPIKPLVKQSKQELVYRIPDCVHHFFAASVDPFTAMPGACLPADLFPLPSSKTRSFVRGRMVLGTSGIGSATFAPVGANDAGCVNVTTAASAGTTATALGSFTNILQLLMPQLPYSTAQLTAGVAWRLVAAGIRVKYVGQLAARNGLTMGYEDPDHRDVRSMTFDSLASNPYSDLNRVGSDEWDEQVCCSGPVTPSELEFQSIPWQSAGGNNFMAIVVSGIAGDIFEVEAYEHLEFIGTNVINKTPSHAEAGLFGKVVEVLKGASVNTPLNPAKGPGLWEKFKTVVSDTLPSIMNFASGAGKILGGDFVAGGSQLFETAFGAGVDTNKYRLFAPTGSSQRNGSSQLLLR